MKGLYYLKRYLEKVVIFAMMPVLLCFFLLVGQGMAMDREKADSRDLLIAELSNPVDEQIELDAEKFGREAEIWPAMDQNAVVDNIADVEDDLAMIKIGNATAEESAGLVVARAEPSVVSPELSLATPPPDGVTLAGKKNSLLIAASSTSPPMDPGKSKTGPAPGPKTSKSSSISTPVLVAAGLAAAVGVAVAAGGGSGSDSSSDSSSTSAPTTPASTETDVIKLSDLVRIGDDTDYNAHHPDKFKVSHPSGTSWTDTFSIDNISTVKSAKFSYTVAASKVGNPIYINGRQAGRLCNPGNTAWNVEACSTNITGYIRAGSNEIKIKCATDPSDTVTPLDDVELYNLRIQLTR